MCLECWDADKRGAMIKKGLCEGKLTPFMTMNTLRKNLVDKWKDNHQTEHTVFREAIINPPGETYQWTELLNGNTPVKMSVKFI